MGQGFGFVPFGIRVQGFFSASGGVSGVRVLPLQPEP